MRITRRQLRGLIKEALTQAQRATAAYAAERRHEWPSVQDYEAETLRKAKAGESGERPAVQDTSRGSDMLARAEGGAYSVDGKHVTDQEAPPTEQLKNLREMGVTVVWDLDGDGRAHEIDDWEVQVSQAQGSRRI